MKPSTQFQFQSFNQLRYRFRFHRVLLRQSLKFYQYLQRRLRKASTKDRVFFYLLSVEESQKHLTLSSIYKEFQHREIPKTFNNRLSDPSAYVIEANSHITNQTKDIYNFIRIKHTMDHARSKENFQNNYMNPNEESFSNFLKSKFLGAVKSTKESSYVKSIYGTGSAGESNGPFATELPSATKIRLFPNYARLVDGVYLTRVKGSITCPGTASRKNKLLLNLALHITKPSSTVVNKNDNLDKALKDTMMDSNGENFETGSGNTATSSIIYDNGDKISNDLVKKRMEGILSQNINDSPINITIGSTDTTVDQLLGAKIYSDNFGMFEITVQTPYPPSYVVVSSEINSDILQTCDIQIVEDKGVSVITDIDDTIRETGVIGDKRDVFRNIFNKKYSDCEIPGMTEFLNEMYYNYHCPIHYVSNSPWQIFNIVEGFMSYFKLPVTSIHLRQYSGNLIASFTQPSAERKRPSLVNIFNDFPHRKFILIGDSGEQDLEAYLSLIPLFRDQIVSIYIRVVPNSLSSLGNDEHVLKELQDILSTRHSNNITNEAQSDFDNKVINEASNTETKIGNFLNNKLAPLVPKKPINLQGNKIHQDEKKQLVPEPCSRESKLDEQEESERIQKPNLCSPTNPKTVSMNIAEIEKIPPLPPRPQSTPVELNDQESAISQELHESIGTVKRHDSRYTRSQGSYDSFYVNNFDGNIEDKRRLIWKAKIERVVREVPDNIEVVFWKGVNEISSKSVKIVLRETK